YRPGKEEWPVEPGADVLDEREGRDRPRVAAGPRRDRDQSVRALLDRLGANRLLMMSCSVIPPYPCTAVLTSSRAPSEVMTIGAFHLTVSARSSSSRAFDLCTIWLTAKGAAGRSGWARSCAASASVISCSHSSSCEMGRAFRAGKAPTIPALHWAMTSAGCEMMNSGAPTTGRRSLCVSMFGNTIEALGFPCLFTYKPIGAARASNGL